ncbi:hypothetical protein A9P82_15020 [Arachidicoccus ginsenosidimutans]|uniref:type IX secretion system lipoprotein PorK/GldK n=1 Tax=Arachidicoccus sp. BS20 TaxID=1850526 RepID=UPI0007F0E8B6|nr:SUMF1/EgtB/PvdO family nonheme iron enzyme [Arachidicoccus sp. BS20]ANI90483.1 hypothetical protein A9P82_15020 [Arachidicoccus sp. BS20]
MSKIKLNFYGALLLSAAAMFAGCKAKMSTATGLDDGVVHGAKYGVVPKGMDLPSNMVYVPTGSFQLAGGGSVSVNGFWMDKYEVTNAQYHQFVNWVRDSIAAVELGYVHVSQDGDTTVDWTKAKKINWKDSAILGRLTGLMLPPEDLLNNQPEIDPKKLVYTAHGYDFNAAAHHPDQPRKNFIYTYSVPIYPDTLVWIKDFDYSYNISMVRDYFSNPAYAQYPVVGVTWRQATAFAHWRTNYLNQYLGRKKLASGNVYRLPTEAEFEYAARGGHNNFLYPWGNYLKNNKGCIMANFKDGRGNYTDDGALYPARVDSYFPNDYGLYNMSGNVAEWTSTSFVNGYQVYDNDFNPNISINATSADAADLKRKTVRGGSWKDPAIDIRVNARSYEYMDSARSYIGFRCVIDIPPKASKK